MLNKGQKQNVDGGSTAIQANGNVIVNGLTYAEVKDVALDVFKANFYELAGVARETARTRAEEITEAFLFKLQQENPDGFKKSDDPDFQYALFTVQKEYARNGDKELGDLLVDLLVDRSKQEQRNILQIVLNESLITAPKLTERQLAALAVIFLFRLRRAALAAMRCLRITLIAMLLRLLRSLLRTEHVISTLNSLVAEQLGWVQEVLRAF